MVSRRFHFLVLAAMSDEKRSLALFFPPRLIEVDIAAVDQNEEMDKACQAYLEKGVVFLYDSDIADAQKIINYGWQFPALMEQSHES